MSTVWIIRAMPSGSDSRVSRWREIYAGRCVRLLSWGGAALGDGVVIPGRPVVGSRWMPLLYPWFMAAVFWVGLLRFKRGDRVVCVDLEALLGAWLAAWLRGAETHFDVADPFHLAKPVPCKGFWRWLEGRCIDRVKWVTAPHASRFLLYAPVFCRANRYVVENVPMLIGQRPLNISERSELPLRLGYFGGLEAYRGIEDLISLVQQSPGLTLKIGGRGTLAAFVAAAARSCSRISFTGFYDVAELPTLMFDVDIYCALYYAGKPLHSYASPNKYYESLALARPILISKRVPQSTDVVRDGTGWVVEQDGIDALRSALSIVNGECVTSGSVNAACMWRERYADYYKKLVSEQGHHGFLEGV